MVRYGAPIVLGGWWADCVPDPAFEQYLSSESPADEDDCLKRDPLLEKIRNRHRFFRQRIRLVPPAATERLEQRGRIGQAIGACLHESKQRLLIGLLRIEQRQETDVTQAQPLLRDLEAAQCGAFGR